MPHVIHPQLKSPGDRVSLWRYSDFPKFVALVQKQCLHFSSLETLSRDDPWEGMPSVRNFDSDSSSLYLDVRSEKLKFHIKTNNEAYGKDLKEAMSSRFKAYLDLRHSFYVNCWHMNEGESVSQWKLYDGSQYSIAIVTSFKRLRDSIVDKRNVYGGRIKYYRPKLRTREHNALLLAIHKRHAYAHEREYRLILWGPETFKDSLSGFDVAVHLKTLIQRIVVSPFAPDWFVQVVRTFLHSQKLKLPVLSSQLLIPLK